MFFFVTIILWSEVMSREMFGLILTFLYWQERLAAYAVEDEVKCAGPDARMRKRERENVRVARRARWQGGVEKEKERHGSRIVFAKYQYLRPPCWYLCSTRPNSTDLTQPIRPQLTPLCHPLFFSPPPPPPRLFTNCPRIRKSRLTLDFQKFHSLSLSKGSFSFSSSFKL